MIRLDDSWWWFEHGSKSINPQNYDWNTQLPKHDCIYPKRYPNFEPAISELTHSLFDVDSRINTQALVHWAGRFDHQFLKDATWGLWFWQLLSIRTGSLFFHSPPPSYSTFEMVSSPPKTEVEKPKPRGQKHSTSCWFQTFFIFPYLGKRSNLTNIFQMGSNHQLVKYLGFAAVFFGSKKSRVSFGRPGPVRPGAGRVQQRLGCLMA